jgi:hypothetical protein
VTATAFVPRAAARVPQTPLAAVPGPGGPAGTPPAWLPGGHFAVAIAFFVAGAVGLVRVAPDLAAGAFPLPRVAAVAHLFTLGWITTAIMGALYQFLPVALGTPIRSVRLAGATGVAYAVGLALFLAGLTGGSGAAMLAGAVVFGVALLGFAGNLAATLWRAPERGFTWWCLAAAGVFLVATVVLGASLTANLRWGHLGAARFSAVGVHVHVAAAGWVMLVILGVGRHLLPMFLLSHGASERPGKAAAVLLAAGAGVLLLFHHGLVPAVRWGVGAMLAAGAAAFIVQAALYFRARRKPRLDAGMRLAGAGVALLVATVAIGAPLLARGLADPRLATAYGVALIPGALGLFVAGHVYKIVPFLAWFHRYGPRVGKGPVPRVADLYDARTAAVAGALLASGAAGLVGGVLAGSATVAGVAGSAYAAGAVLLAAQMTETVTRRHT